MSTKSDGSGLKTKRPQTGKQVRTLPNFVAPQLCTLVKRPPLGPGWAHEIKFDGYRIQMRVEDGEVTLRTRKDLDWTEKFPAIANAARRFPDCINQRMRHDRKQFAGGQITRRFSPGSRMSVAWKAHWSAWPGHLRRLAFVRHARHSTAPPT